MNKFCTNCGAELNEKAVICVKCGAATNNVLTQPEKTKQPGKGTGITSMILSIISTVDSIFALFIFVCLLAAGEYFLPYEKLAFGFIFLISPIILLTIGLALGFVSRSKIQNGINLTGILLGFISLALCILSIGILYLL